MKKSKKKNAIMDKPRKLKIKHRWEEKRLSRRIPQDNVPIAYDVVSGFLGLLRARRPRYRAVMLDRSVDGLRIATDGCLNQGEVVKIWLDIFIYDQSASTTITLRGTVAWSVIDDDKICTAGIKIFSRQRDNDLKLWVEDIAANMNRLGQ